MSLEEIEWTESEGDSGDNFVIGNVNPDSDDSANSDAFFNTLDSSRSRRQRDEDLEPEIEEAYQEARNLYTQGDYDSALILLEEAIKHDASSKLLFNLLVSIHEERQDYEKALIAKVAVAHLDKRDKETWIDIAERSVSLGHLAQAAVFFQHVSRLDRNNWQILRTRADLQMQLGNISAALSLLQRIRFKFFSLGESVGLYNEEKTDIFLNIAGALKDLGRIEEATEIYMNIYRFSLSVSNVEQPEVELDWQNLNILAELLFDQQKYSLIIVIVKDGARWLNFRGNEQKFWQRYNLENDAEYDGRRTAVIARMEPMEVAQISMDEQQFFLPIDIRIWLLQCRLKLIPAHMLLSSQPVSALESLQCVSDARIHLAELYECRPVEAYSDLYRRAALSFFNARLYAEARELYTSLTDIAHESLEDYLNMTIQVAKCEMELANIERAEYLYNFILERDPQNQESLVALGEIYAATDRVKESQGILSILRAARSEQQEQQQQLQLPGGEAGNVEPQLMNQNMNMNMNRSTHSSSGAVFVEDDTFQRVRNANARPTRAERAEADRVAREKTDNAFINLTKYHSGLVAGNMITTLEWLRYADELVKMFASHRKFFPANKQKDFFSFKGSSMASVSERIDRLILAQQDHDADDEDDDENVDSEMMVDEELTEDREKLEESFVWRGKPLSTWFFVIMRAAIEHARVGNSHRAQEVINIASAANIFNFNHRRREIIELVGLSCAYISKDYELLGELLRHIQTQHQFNTLTFRLYMVLLSSGEKAIEIFGSSNNQKFFLRQIKAMDSVVHYKKPVQGMAKVIDPKNAPTSDDPQLLMLYVYTMLLGPSYVPALTYLIRVRAQLPDHPLVLLIYGIIQTSRAAQRTSYNRHIQILEGLSYMLDYKEKRGSELEHQVEANYNMGRLFHGIGLLTQAIKFYETALRLSEKIEKPEHNLGLECAYNLQLIYATNGSPELSMEIIEKYLSV